MSGMVKYEYLARRPILLQSLLWKKLLFIDLSSSASLANSQKQGILIVSFTHSRICPKYV